MISEVIKLYEDRNDVTLTTYILQDSPQLLAGGRRPAIIICPGGAYLDCSDREAEPVAMKFASMGYHTFVLRYSRYGTEPDGSKADFFGRTSEPLPKEHCLYPTHMREIGKSMLIIHEHAAKWLVDTDKIAVCGFSAGAHNAAMYATHWHEEVISGFFGKTANDDTPGKAADYKEKLRPAAAILGYTLSDYLLMKEAVLASSPEDAAFFGLSNTAFLGEAIPTDERLLEVSPARNVTENTPPTFLWATSADAMVPVQQSLQMAAALADHHIPFEMHIFEEGAHGLSLATPASAGTKSQINGDAAKWADLAGCWLEKRFALPVPDKNAE